MSFDLQGVRVVYPGRAGPVQALDGVTLHIATGERVAVLGPSGAGKSTLLRLLNATLRPTSGVLRIHGRDSASLRGRDLRRLRRGIGTIFQHPSLVPPLSALQNALCGRIASWSLLRSVRALVAPPPDEVQLGKSALATVGLVERAGARADELSGGQQQRVAIARVLVQDPQVVLADEPFASLDPGLTVQLADLLGRVCEKRTLVAMLHDVQLAVERFPRIVGLRSGRVLFDLPAREVTPGRLQDLYAREGGG
jgi:phosphonate transport system ATP-binding protein